MQPIVTVDRMRAIDAAASQSHEQLVQRAGWAVANAALELIGGAYGRRVIVVAGPGNNGADGRVAADRLRERGALVSVINAVDAEGTTLPHVDLVIDAAYGTGFRGEYQAPSVGSARVLAVDIPTGIDGNTGEARGNPVRADATVTFAALKPGLLYADGPSHTGVVTVADIGLDVTDATAWVVEDGDIFAWLPQRRANAHKWNAACAVVAGSPGMRGAAHLTSAAALRAGAGMVRLHSPGLTNDELDDESYELDEVVVATTPAHDWASTVMKDLDRFKALVLGPGLGADEATLKSAREVCRAALQPLVLDADGLRVCATFDDLGVLAATRNAATIVTPHDGEFARLAQRPPSADRIGEAHAIATSNNVTIVLKGNPTTVAGPDGRVLVVTSGDARLATPGTGDVLAGMIAAALARGAMPTEAAAAAAHVHGAAARGGWSEGFVASDMLELIPSWLTATSQLHGTLGTTHR